MSDCGSNEERDFLITGARTYLDADDAMALFRRRIQAEITTLVDDRLGEISRACGREWSANDVKDYTERQTDAYFIGKRLDVKNQGAIYFYLEIRRESSALNYAAGASLYRPNQSLWPDLWERIKEEPAETAGCTGNSAFFHQKLASEESVPDLVEPLALALDEFVAFMSECGGIPKDAWPAP